MSPLEAFINPLTSPYWQALREHRLLLAACEQCRYLRPPPDFRTRGGPFVFLQVCPNCAADSLAWKRSQGSGIVETFVWYMTDLAPNPPELAPFELPIPYNVSVVRLDDGPRLITNVVDVELGALRVGTRVKAVFVDLPDWTILRFAPANGSTQL